MMAILVCTSESMRHNSSSRYQAKRWGAANRRRISIEVDDVKLACMVRAGDCLLMFDVVGIV
jgi:hypothetical protein